MKKIFLEKELNVIRNNIFKALNIYEEENGIEPKNKRAHKPVVVYKPLTFEGYIDKINKNIEGLIGWLASSGDNLDIINGLSDIKVKLHSIQRIAGEEYYPTLRQIMFKNLSIISELIELHKTDD